jgi:hypothetical protein
METLDDELALLRSLFGAVWLNGDVPLLVDGDVLPPSDGTCCSPPDGGVEVVGVGADVGSVPHPEGASLPPTGGSIPLPPDGAAGR